MKVTIFQKRRYAKSEKTVCFPRFAIVCIAVVLLFSAAFQAQDIPQPARKPVLIRDTAIAEGNEREPEQAKEPNPKRSKENLSIGNTYFKKGNYAAAISRYIEAIAWQENSIPAHEALARVYEKKGEFTEAIQTLEAAIEKNPDSSKNKGFHTKIASLRKKLR